MKIAMIGQKRVPSREGGIEVAVTELAVRMAARGHRVTVYNRAGPPPPGAAWEGARMYEGVRIVTVPTPRHGALNAPVYALLATLHALLRGYDVLHYHAEGPSAMLRLPALLGLRTVSTVHGLDWRRAKWGRLASRYLLHGERILARRADEVIVLSESARLYFQETYGRETRCIPNGVSPAARREPRLIREKYGLRGGDYFLFLARLVPEKGAHTLLEAFLGLDTDRRLVLAGSGTGAYAAALAAQAAGDPRVLLTGFVQGEELAELYSGAALYILPSELEGMPLSLLEALSYGCPCLVSDIPENLEAAGRCAAAFPAGDAAALRACLRAFLDGQLPLPAPGDSAAAVPRRLSWDEVTEQTLAVYAGSGQGESVWSTR